MGYQIKEINKRYFELAIPSSDLGTYTGTDYSARCIICGDSKKNKNKKRLHLYTKSTYDDDSVHCFNCGFSGNMYSFLKAVNIPLYNQYKEERKKEFLEKLKSEKEIMENLSIVRTSTNNNKEKFDIKTFKLSDIQGFIQRITPYDNDEFMNYLRNRSLDVFVDRFKMYKTIGYLNIAGKEIKIDKGILIPFEINDELYGFQIRSITQKFFYTYIPDENTSFKVWNFFNVLNSDKKQIFVFESVFDSISSNLENDEVISMLGSDLNDERIFDIIKHGKELVFCFDNQNIDKTAREKIDKILSDYKDFDDKIKVFLWKENIKYKDMNEMLIKIRNTSKDINDFFAKINKIPKLIKKNIKSKSVSSLIENKLGRLKRI